MKNTTASVDKANAPGSPSDDTTAGGPRRGSEGGAIRVLLVDDHTIVRQGVRALLAATADLVVVGEAADGPAGLALAAKEQPDVVVVNLSLPGMHGTEVVRQLKSAGAARVVVLSMHASPEAVGKARGAGCDAYVVKGGDVAELAEAIRTVHAGKTFFSSAVAGAPAGGRSLERLSARERQILALIARSGTNKTIATELGISVHTVNAHRVSLMAKLDLHDAQGLTRFALEHGLLAPTSDE